MKKEGGPDGSSSLRGGLMAGLFQTNTGYIGFSDIDGF